MLPVEATLLQKPDKFHRYIGEMDRELEVAEIWSKDPGTVHGHHRPDFIDLEVAAMEIQHTETERLLQQDPATFDEALDMIARLRQKLCMCREMRSDEARDCSLDAYFSTSIAGHLLQRLPWLMSLLLLESVSAYSLSRFQSMLDHHMTLALFCPMIVGTAGNAGNQPGVIFTRAISMGQFDALHSMREFFKRESILAVVVAATMSGLALCRTTATSSDLLSCIAVSMTVFFVIMFAIGAGLGFSYLIHSCGLDPAAGAAPLLTTLSDVIGVLVLCLVSMGIFYMSGRQFDLT
jgi:Mg/Co/Ni transporter MgtE